MHLDLTGKQALVGGSSQGLGWASAQELALFGANVTLVARNEKKLIQRVKELDHSKGQQHDYLVLDFQDTEAVRQAADAFVKMKKVNILVNNTGGPPPGLLLNATATQLIQGLQQHLINFHHLVQAVVPSMKAAGYGRIINIISTSVKEPLPNLGVSNTVRAAVASWSKTLAGELAPHGITVNNILPGFIRTARYESLLRSRMEETGKSAEESESFFVSRIPAGRIGEPSEFAAMVAFIATPAASYVNGATITVDGGRTGSI